MSHIVIKWMGEGELCFSNYTWTPYRYSPQWKISQCTLLLMTVVCYIPQGLKSGKRSIVLKRTLLKICFWCIWLKQWEVKRGKRKKIWGGIKYNSKAPQNKECKSLNISHINLNLGTLLPCHSPISNMSQNAFYGPAPCYGIHAL